MKTLYKKALSLLFITIFSSTTHLFAQCAMCRATIENNISTGEGTVGMGLNTGILYLMIMPYILIAGIAYYWYKMSKKRQLHQQGV